MASGPITTWQTEGGKRKYRQISSFWAPESLRTVTAVMKSEYDCSLKGKQ